MKAQKLKRLVRCMICGLRYNAAKFAYCPSCRKP